MEENNSHRKPIEEKDIPVSVPSVDAAWSDMLQKLDRVKPIAELASESGKKGISVISFNKVVITISLLSIMTAVLFVHNYYMEESIINTKLQKDHVSSNNKSDENGDKNLPDVEKSKNVLTQKSNIDQQNNFDLALKTHSKNKDSIVEILPDATFRVINGGGKGMLINGSQKNIRLNDRHQATNKHKGKVSYTVIPILQNKNSSASIENNSLSNQSATHVNKSQAVAKTNTIPFEDQNGLSDSNQVHLVDSTSMSKKEKPEIDSSKMKNLVISKNFGGPDTIENSGKWRLQAGLSWSLQLPFSGFRGYFQGPNTSSQPYRILFPAFWMQLEQKKSLLSFEVNPFISNNLPEKPFRTSTIVSYLQDTIITTTEVKTLYKVFGLSTSIGYNYHVGKNWWIGGNMQFCWWANGLVFLKGLVQKTPINGGSVAQESNFEKEYRISDEWSYFNRAQFFVNSEMLYRKEKWQAGLTAGIAATPLAIQEGPGNTFRMSLFYRWSLYSKR